MNNAQRLHESAVADEQNAEKTLTVRRPSQHSSLRTANSSHTPLLLQLKRQYQQKLEDELQKRKASVNDFQHRKDVNDVSRASTLIPSLSVLIYLSHRKQFRETKLSEIHADAASRAGSRANSINRGPFPVGKAAGGSGNKPQQATQPLRESPEPIANNGAGPAGAAGAGGGGDFV